MSTNDRHGGRFPHALEPGARVGRWRVVEPLGVGGQGAVYLVEDLDHPGERFALKLALHAHDGRAEREVALMMAPAVHPNVVRFHGCARWPHPREGCLGFLMDWVPGLALDVWAETPGITFRQLVRVGATVASTLGELHARGVLHRDLKPEHIRIRASDGEPVLLDFGVGWFAGAVPLTPGPLPPTSLHVLSPEAVRFLWTSPLRAPGRYAFQPTDDLYALGVCLYRAVTGHYPFTEWLATDVLQYAIVHRRPLSPVELDSRVPRALSDIIMRLLAKTPEERYPSGAEVHDALLAAYRETASRWDAPIHEEGRPPLRLPEGPAPARGSPVPRSSRGRDAKRAGLVLAGVALLGGAWLLARHASGWLGGGLTDGTGAAVPTSAAAPSPLKNQKRAPCTPKLEVEYSGACWFPHQQRPPDCPPQTVSYDGRCLLPVSQPRPAVPNSLEPASPGP